MIFTGFFAIGLCEKKKSPMQRPKLKNMGLVGHSWLQHPKGVKLLTTSTIEGWFVDIS